MSGFGTFWLILLATIAIVGIAVLGMALGVMTTGRCLRGSCGGPEVRLADGRSLSCSDCPNRKQRAAD
jgi:hypothetical protein